MSEAPSPATLTIAGRILAVVALLALGGSVAGGLIMYGKNALQAPVIQPLPDVNFTVVTLADVPVEIESQGLLEAVTESRVAAEVAGRVVSSCPAWDDGGTFKQGEELMRLDDADYQAALANAISLEAEAVVAERMEVARAGQAERDWKKLVAGTPASDLVTRQPQLKAAQARAAATKAGVEKAKRDLERTVLRAPYDGRIRRTHTDIGSYVVPGAMLADLYATETLQVRLPLPLDEFSLLDMGESKSVKLTATVAGEVIAFAGHVVRGGGEIERTSRTMPVVVSVNPSAARADLIVPGLFVKAQLTGRTLEKVARLPRVAMLAPGNRVAVIGPGNRLATRTVTVARAGMNDVFVSQGVNLGEKILTTSLAVIIEGMAVQPLSKIAGS